MRASCFTLFLLLLLSIWNNCSITLKTNLQKLQNRAARIITSDTYDIRSKQILEKLGWKTLEERREDKLKKYMRKIAEDDCPETISNLFKNATIQIII